MLSRFLSFVWLFFSDFLIFLISFVIGPTPKTMRDVDIIIYFFFKAKEETKTHPEEVKLFSSRSAE